MRLSPATRQLRLDLAIVADSANRRTADILSSNTSGDKAKAQLLRVLPGIVAVHRSAAVAVSTDWYDEQRADQGVRGRFRALAVPESDEGDDEDSIAALVGWGLGPVYDATPDWLAAGVLIAGGLQRRVLEPARDSITLSTKADPKAKGWRREGEGKCEYCARRINSGVVWLSGELACHDHCGCQAVPAWE